MRKRHLSRMRSQSSNINMHTKLHEYHVGFEFYVCRLCVQAANARTRLHIRADSPESSLFVNDINAPSNELTRIWERI